MAGYAIKQLEDGILAVLKPLQAAKTIKTLRSYQGDLEKKDEQENLIETIKGITPAVLAIFAGSKGEDVNRQIRETMFFGLIVIEESLRGVEFARRGSTTNQGVYAIIDSVRGILDNNMLGLDILPLEWQATDPLHFDTSIAVYTLLYRTEQTYVKEITR
jgi:hypothetical protein